MFAGKTHVRAQSVHPPAEQMPRSVTSRKGWPGCTLEGVGGWILGHQAKLSDLLIKEKPWLVILFAPVEREDGRIE